MTEMTKKEIQAALKRLADEEAEAFIELLGKVLGDDPDLAEAVNRTLARVRARKSPER